MNPMVLEMTDENFDQKHKEIFTHLKKVDDMMEEISDPKRKAIAKDQFQMLIQ